MTDHRAVRRRPEQPQVATLVYELLDALDDTARLAAATELADADVAWAAHLDYLQALQRTGREVLAPIPAGHVS
jgi:hypothetical protein